MSSFARRLPIYLLLDCSESMAGSAIQDMTVGVEAMLGALRNNPLALETAYLSVITFSRDARQAVPLTELLQFRMPKLSVRTGTALGAALRLLAQCVDREVVKTTPTSKGDYRPLVMLFTDGQPTDEWQTVAEDVRTLTKPRIANLYAIGCGPDVDNDVLYRMTDIVLQMTDMSAAGWKKVFVWLSASTSRAIETGGGGGGGANLPALPSDVLAVAPRSSGPKDPRPRQVFLQARCSRTGKPYLMRFARRLGERYEAVASHPLDEFETEGGEALPPINTALLDGCPKCAHCENPIAGMCPCGGLMCASGQPGDTVVCPHCHARIQSSGAPSVFDVRRVQG